MAGVTDLTLEPRPLRVVRQPIPRVEAVEKVTGRAYYAADWIPAGALWTKLLRSPYAHARIKCIDAMAARQVPGVQVVLTGADVPDVLLGQQVHDMPILARDVVRFFGDRVAAVAATDPLAAEDALSIIEVEYEELPAVFDPIAAQAPDAPLLHPAYASYRRPMQTTDPDLRNVQSVTRFSRGDVERGFAEAARVFEHEFRTQSVHQGYIEPHCCTIEVKADGRIHVWAADQAPYKARHHLAEVLDCPAERIVLHPVFIGGSFGAKDDVADIPLVYCLAAAAGRPVTLLWTYSDELLFGTPRHSAVIRLKTGVTADGRLLAHDGLVMYNGGAYGAIKPNPEGNMTGGIQLGGSYRIPHTRLESRCVYTNQVPGGYMRSPGEAQTHFAVESHMDMIAVALGMDPVHFRRLNALVEGDETPQGYRLRDVRCQEVLARAAERSGWGQPLPPSPDGRLRGRGVAIGDRHTGTALASTRLALNADGTVTLFTVLPDVGPGAHTVMCQIAAEVLGISAQEFRVHVGSTDEIRFDQGVKGMSATYSSGMSVQGSAEALIGVLKERAAGEWGVSVGEVEWADGAVHLRLDPAQRLDLRALGQRGRDDPAVGSYTFEPKGKPDVLSFQAQVATVAVDPETGEVTVERLVSAHDVARIINPITHRGQIEGAITQGFGYAVMEELLLDGGRVMSPSLGEYRLPTICDVPPLELEYVEAATGPAPFDAKGVAEAGISSVAPVIANAVYQATGVRFTEIPITAEKVRSVLRDRAEAEARQAASRQV